MSCVCTGASWALRQPGRTSGDGFLEEVTVLKAEWEFPGRRKAGFQALNAGYPANAGVCVSQAVSHEGVIGRFYFGKVGKEPVQMGPGLARQPLK